MGRFSQGMSRAGAGAGIAVVMALGLGGAGSALGASSCPAPISGLGSGRVFYVSPSGSDGNIGTSPCAPWQTMAKVESAGLRAGDTAAFQGGQAFAAPLSPWGGTDGVFYTSYGVGQADLTGGVYLNSVTDLTFDNLDITDAAGPGIGTGGGGSGATGIDVVNSTISSTYSAGIGGYGIGLRNVHDANWTIAGDNISNTADSGIAFIGSSVTIEDDILRDDGIGPYCGTGSGQNPCHGVYAKGPGATVLDNVIARPQDVGVSLRDQNNVVQGNTIAGGQKGIAFSSETTTPGTTYIVGNTISGQRDTGIQSYPGTRPLYESFVIASNTVYDPANYAVYLSSGPNSAASQTVTLANNLLEIAPGALGYLNLAYPASYTSATYLEHYDAFYGAGTRSAFYINGSARTWSTYTSWFGSRTEGRNDLTSSDPMLDTTTFALGYGSPAIGAGTLGVPGIAYAHVASCPIADSAVPLAWQYCAKTPDMGSS
jgi:hypothetical protein